MHGKGAAEGWLDRGACSPIKRGEAREAEGGHSSLTYRIVAVHAEMEGGRTKVERRGGGRLWLWRLRTGLSGLGTIGWMEGRVNESADSMSACVSTVRRVHEDTRGQVAEDGVCVLVCMKMHTSGWMDVETRWAVE